jgi:DNA-binding transcriptional LysR family regulator
MQVDMAFDWNDIPLLLAVARHGSLAGAARELRVDATTVGRRLATAEAALGATLFVREGGRYRPTTAGEAALARASVLAGEVRELLHEVQAEQGSLAGTVRLTSVEFVLGHWLAPYLPDLLDRYPRLDLELVSDNRNLSFTRREADLALRLGRPGQDSALVMRKAAEVGYAVYGVTGCQAGPVAEWPERRWLGYDQSLRHLPEMQWLEHLLAGRAPRVRMTNLAAACKAGCGLALLPCIVGDQEGLERLSDGPVLHRELWLLSHRELRHTGRVKAVSDWLWSALESSASRLRGEV